MMYLHEAPYNETLVRHWVNESESVEDTVATFCIRQVETDTVYSEAIDVVPCRYTYEATDIPIETDPLIE